MLIGIFIHKLKGGTMVKKWKIFVSVIVLIAVAGAGSLYYFLNIKEYETNDSQVDEIVEGEFNIELPADSSEDDTAESLKENSTEKEPVDKDESISSPEIDRSKSANTKTKTKAPVQSTEPIVKPTAAMIIEKYQPSFSALESQANDKIETLLTYAFGEYKTKKANGEEISYFYLYNKYNSAANKLESSTDASFDYIYSALVTELEKSNYDKSEAQYIKEHYMNIKKERRAALLNKARNHLNI
jgi:hypothetical protein